MLMKKEWERFYTTVADATVENNLVDQVSVDEVNHCYVLEIGVGSYVTDGYAEDGEERYSHYVSRSVFDIIVKGLDRRGYEKVAKN